MRQNPSCRPDNSLDQLLSTSPCRSVLPRTFMRSSRIRAGWLALAAGSIWLTFAERAGEASGQEQGRQVAKRSPPLAAAGPLAPTSALPMQELPPKVKDQIRKVVEQPTLATRGP